MNRRPIQSIAILFAFISTLPLIAAELPDLAKTKLAAEKGDLQAQIRLADKYYSSFDPVEAAKWYRLTAEKGDAHSQYRLGQISMTDQYSGTKRLPANPTEAVQWLLKAANQNHE